MQHLPLYSAASAAGTVLIAAPAAEAVISTDASPDGTLLLAPAADAAITVVLHRLPVQY